MQTAEASERELILAAAVRLSQLLMRAAMKAAAEQIELQHGFCRSIAKQVAVCLLPLATSASRVRLSLATLLEVLVVKFCHALLI